MNWTPIQRPLVESYARGYAWICLFDKDPKKAEDFEKVNQRMMQIEEKLKELDVTPEQIDKVIESIKKIVSKPMDELNPKEMNFMASVIFGKDSKVYIRPEKADEIILELAKVSPKGFQPAREISKQLKMSVDDLLKDLQTLADMGDILQYKPGWDSWAVSFPIREKLLYGIDTDKPVDIESNIDTVEEK